MKSILDSLPRFSPAYRLYDHHQAQDAREHRRIAKERELLRSNTWYRMRPCLCAAAGFGNA